MNKTESDHVNATCNVISILVSLPFLAWLFVISWKIALCFFMLMWMNNVERDTYEK